MKIGNYSVTIPEGREYQENGATYVALQDEQEFTIHFDGPWNSRAGCKIWMNGEPIHGPGWVMTFNDDPCTLKRPANSDEGFQFFKTTGLGKNLGAQSVDPEKRGLIRIEIRPEIPENLKYQANTRSLFSNTRGSSSGVAGTSGKATGQKFGVTTLGNTSEPIIFLFRLVAEYINSPRVFGVQSAYPTPVQD